MAYEDRAYVKSKFVKAALDDFEFQRMLKQMKRSGYSDRSKYIRGLILADIQSQERSGEKVQQSANA